MPDRDAHYWVGNLSTTIALAASSPEPKPILKAALQEFLQDRPADDPLAKRLRARVSGGKPV